MTSGFFVDIFKRLSVFSNASEGLNEKFSGRGADGSTPVLGTGGFRFDPELPDFEN